MKPTPNIVTRGRVIESSEWTVVDTPPIVGACSTDLRARVMHVPMAEGDLEQAIRGHEMIHAGWSPIHSAQTIARVENLDARDIEACEEWRINAVAWKAGIDSMILADPADVANAEKFARARTLAPALRLVVQSHGTSSHRRVLKTLRKYAPGEWSKPISDVQKSIRRVMREHNLADRRTSHLYEHTVTRDEFGGKVWGHRTFIIPRGFDATLELAKVLRTWRYNDPTPTREEEQRKTQAERERAEAIRRAKALDERMGKFHELPEFDLEGTGYESVRLLDLDHDLEHRGKTARRRVASTTGKNPRRVSRWIDDPERRVFDRRVRARGGVVLIDQSGSMSLEREDIDRLLEQAGGAVVIGYSDTGSNKANVWVHAQNGHRSSTTPTGGSENNVDGSALMFALSRREQRRHPVIWVTDGRCYEASGGLSEKTCAILEETVTRHNVTMVQNIDEAIAELGRLARGNQPRTKVNALIQSLARAYRTGETR